MKVLRRVRIALAACFVLTSSLALGMFARNSVSASADDATDVSHYFYSQLKEDAQKQFYKAMEAMNDNGIFIAGDDYDLVENGHVTQAQLEAYALGDNALVDAMGAARDAFYTDYADIFYVDFGYLSLRVTLSEDGLYHAYLGKGRSDTYYVTGFDSMASVEQAIAKYNEVLDNVLDEVKKAEPTEAQKTAYGDELATTVAQLQAAHAWIAENTIYKLESTCTPGNEGHVRTPYGVFVAKHDDGTQNKFLDKDQGEALCEGYSRAFKVIADKLGVPCVLVNGVYRHAEDKEELHMWCHVQLDGEWYAVDQTFDDLNRRSGATGVLLTGLGDAYSEDYFLKGYSLMNTQHATSAYKSEAEYAFTYPQLSYSNLGSEISTEHGAMIWVEQEPYDATLKSTTIKVSVFVEQTDEYGVGTGVGKWCSYAQAAEKGLYLVVRFEGDYLPEQLLRAGGGDLKDKKYDDYGEKDPFIGNTLMAWGYVNPVPDMYKGLIDDYDKGGPEGGGYTVMRDTSKPSGFEFAVTTVAPRPYDYEERFNYTAEQAEEQFRFLGDPTMFVARSGFIETLYAGNKDVYAPPYIVKATPSSWGKLSIGKGPYNIEVEYDQYLKLKDGDSKIQMSVVGMRATGEFVKGTNAVVLEKVVDLSTLKWDRGIGDNEHYTRGGRVSFKFTPSPEYAHDNIMYYFSLNLVGENSGNQVNPIEYCAGYESDACCYKANGFHWNVYAQPQLVESGDLSTEGWKTSDGTDLSNTKSRLALVVTSPSKKQNSQMNDLIGDELNMDQGDLENGGFESFTYNISLTICKGVSIETGQGVRIGIGFPEGFTYDDSMNGVKFIAYHFIRDKQNNVVDVEELEVTVTPLGLIILVKSFSPFAIVAVKGEAPETTDKTVVVSTSSGGTAYAEDGTNLFKVKEGETRKLNIKANNGYIIESVKVDKKVFITNTNEMTLDLDYADLLALSVVEVNFVAQSVVVAEQKRGEGAVTQTTSDAVIQQRKKAEIKFSVKTTVNSETGVEEVKLPLKIGKTLKISPKVVATGDRNVYEWYKDGVLIADQNGAEYVKGNATEEDAGTYRLKVISYFGSSFVTAESVAINVSTDNVAPSNSLFVLIGIGGGILLLVVLTVIILVVVKKRS